MKGLTKDDSERIGFLSSCLFLRALTIEEMQQWVSLIYQEEGTPPTYMLDLLEFKPPLTGIFKAIGFVPPWPYGDEAKPALYGIAYLRGRQSIDCPLSRDQALLKLKEHPEIEDRFRLEFPFVDLPN